MVITSPQGWSDFLKSNGLSVKANPLRLASPRLTAARVVKPSLRPQEPMTLESKSQVYEGWVNPDTFVIAKSYIENANNLSLRELHFHLLNEFSEGLLELPFLLWLDTTTNIERVIYRDAIGNKFVKLNELWEPTVEVRPLGHLIGAQYGTHYLDLPLNASVLIHY